MPAHTIAASGTPFGITMTLAGQTGVSAIALIDTPATTGTVINNGAFQAGRFFGRTTMPTWSAMLAEMSATFGAGRFAALETTAPFGHTDIYAFAPTFTIDVAQDTTNVLKVTESATGTLIDAAPITVEQGGTVQFISNGALAINAPITLKGGGLVDLRYDYSLLQHGGTVDPSAFSFGPNGSVSFLTAGGATATSSQGGNLSINDASYTLIYSMAQLDAIDGVNGVSGATVTTYGPGTNGNYALAGNLDASAQTYSQSVVNNFGGTFEGLGHSISNLMINATASNSNRNIGLFGSSVTMIRDLTLANLNVIGHPSGPLPLFVGGLVGLDGGGLYNDSVGGKVVASDSGQGFVGGVAGEVLGGTVKNVTASASVDGSQGDVGGLVGELVGGTVTASSASGPVTGADGANVGGLVGESWGMISQAFATGSVAGGGNAEVGGLVGSNHSVMDQSYATGNVSGNGNGAAVGGLVGVNNPTSDPSAPVMVRNSYATGKVSNAGTSADYLGGLVGINYSQILDSYATGAVVPAPSTPLYMTGGLVGFAFSSGTAVNSYWNTQTSGQTASAGGIGQTTAQLDGALPNGFDSATWVVASGRGPKLKAVAGQ